MLPPIQLHTFETRLVKTPQDGLVFMRLSRNPEGVLFFISKHPIECRLWHAGEFSRFVDDLKAAYELPVIEWGDIVEIGVSLTK